MDLTKMSYAREKLGLAVNALTVHPGRIQERLPHAMRHLTAVTSSDFPDSLRSIFDNAKEVGNRCRKGEIEVELAVKIANDLVELESRFSGYIKDFERGKNPR